MTGAPANNPTSRVVALGTLAAVVSGVGFAVITVIARSLAAAGLSASTVLSIRFGIGGLLLAAVVVVSGRSLWPPRGERLPAALLGTVGYAFEASLFFAGLERGTAAAVTVLFYCYPALVAMFEVAMRWATPSWRLAGAVAAGATGTALVIAAGANVSVSATGIFFALGAAGSFAAYLVITNRLLVRTDNIVRAAWVSGGAGLGMFVRGLVTGGFDPAGGFWVRLVVIGVANAAAFGMLFAALTRIGATRTAVVLNVEPVAAVILGWLFLGERLGPFQLAGGMLVVLGAVAVALPERDGLPLVELPVHPPP